MPEADSETSARPGAHAIGQQTALEWQSALSSWRNAGVVVSLLGLFVMLLGTVERLVRFRSVFMVTGLACFFVGWLVLVGCAQRLRHLSKRFGATIKAHRRAQLAGNCEATLRHSDELLALMPSLVAPWVLINYVVEASVTAGRYAEALAVTERWSESARTQGAQWDPESWALVEVNLAEAEYCAGRLDAAKERMDRLWQHIEQRSGPFDGNPLRSIVIQGTATQRAWIAALRGAPGESLALLEPVELEGLPKEYRSEVHYTRAFALSGVGDHEGAEKAARAGVALATRASSVRNGMFLLGTLACAREDFQTAVRHFEEGAGHGYRGQGGDALLCWSRALRRLGHTEQAERVAQLVVERDPESAAARQLRAGRHYSLPEIGARSR